MNRHLQLRRNSVDNIYPNRLAAKTFINTTLVNSVTDGEPIIARYTDDTNNICVMLGYAIVKDTVKQIYIIDNTDIIEEINRVEIAAGIDANGNYVKNALARFIKDASNLNDADVKLNNILTNVVDTVGLKAEDGTLVPFVGEYVSASTTVKNAIELLDKEVEDRLKIDNINNTNSVSLEVDKTTSPTTPTLKANLILAPSVGTTGNGTNILKINNNGVFANVALSYNGVNNTLSFENGVESKNITLNAGSIIDSIEYKNDLEELWITYHTTSSTTPIITKVPMVDLITEYNYINLTPAITYDGGKGNVLFKIDRNVSGQSEVRADVEIFDCGTY